MTITDAVYTPLRNEETDEEHAHSPLIQCADKEFTNASGTAAIVFQGASSLSSYINLTNTIVGSGMLGLPYAVAKSGWVLGLVLLAISGVATIFSLHLLTICSTKVAAPSSFYAVTEASIPRFTFLIDFAVFLQTFGAAAAYLIVIGGLMPDVMQQIGATGIWQQRHVWVLLGFAVVAPLSCLRNLDALKYTSAMAVAFVVFLTIIILLFAANVSGMNPCADAEDTENCAGDTHLAVITLDTFRVFSIFIFAFSCQTVSSVIGIAVLSSFLQNIFAVVNELRQPTQRRFDTISWASIGTAGLIYATVAAGGYVTYGSDVESNVLMNYPRNTIAPVYLCHHVICRSHYNKCSPCVCISSGGILVSTAVSSWSQLTDGALENI